MTHIAETIVAVVVLLGVLVMFHELGHFTVSKLLGIKVEEFAFGFGPKWITLFKKGDTEYTIHPYPLGGFVKLAGSEPGEEDVPDGFNSKPWWARFLVYLAGPLMSFVLAYIIFCSLGLTIGLPITNISYNQVDFIEPGSIAEKAGMKIGDIVVQINDAPIKNGNQMVDYIHDSIGKPLDISVDRNGQIIHIHATPKATVVEGKRIGRIGFAPKQKLKRVGFLRAIHYGNNTTVSFVKTFFRVVFSRQAKDAVGGPISIVQETSNSVSRGVNGFLQLMAILSMSLGVINLMPIPVVDGGQLWLLVAEGIKGKALSIKTLQIAQTIGLVTIGLIFVAVFYLDFARLGVFSKLLKLFTKLA